MPELCLLAQLAQQLLLVRPKPGAMSNAITEVRARRGRIAQGNVAFSQTQAIGHVRRKSPHDPLQQLQTSLRFAVTEQRGRCQHVQRAEQTLGRTRAKRRVELGASARVALDFGDQAGRCQTGDLRQPPGDDRATESVSGCRPGQPAHALISILPVGIGIGAASHERFEGVGDREDRQTRAKQARVRRPRYWRVRGRTSEGKRCEQRE